MLTQSQGLLFTSPFVQNNTAFRKNVATSIPTVKAYPSVLDYITRTLYPPIFDGSQAMNYTNQIARAAAISSELYAVLRSVIHYHSTDRSCRSFTCNTFYLDKAYGNDTYSYYFTVPPALHGQDVAYTYYNGPDPSVLSSQIAIALQEYITNFAEKGSPNEPGIPHFQMYGPHATVQDLNITGITEVMDPTANYRCNWWQKALYQ